MCSRDFGEKKEMLSKLYNNGIKLLQMKVTEIKKSCTHIYNNEKEH